MENENVGTVAETPAQPEETTQPGVATDAVSETPATDEATV